MLHPCEYLFPKTLRKTETPVKKCLTIGSCLIGDSISFYKSWYPNVEFEYILFNNVSILPEMSQSEVDSYDFQIVQLGVRYVITDDIVDFYKFNSSSDIEPFMRACEDRLRLMLEAALRYNRENGLLTFVTNFLVPTLPGYSGLNNIGSEFDISIIIRRINIFFASLVREYKNVYIIDIDSNASALGKRFLLDDHLNFFTHNGYWYEGIIENEKSRIEEVPPLSEISSNLTFEFMQTVWDNADYLYRVINQIDSIKLVIFDLDDTLWRGILADNYSEDGPNPQYFGWPMGVAEAIHHLRARGILVAVCSKNSEEIVRERWALAVPYGWFDLDHFVSVQINFEPKVNNIARILEATNLTAKSVLFVDDNPVERQSVQAGFPEMRFIGANPFMTRHVLLRAPELQVESVTTESRNRAKTIVAQKARDEDRTALSRDQFLMGLDCRVTIGEVQDSSDERFRRCFELINKTNQFNTTGVRWSTQAAEHLFSNGGSFVYFSVVDKYSDYGLVGVIVLNNAEIEQFVMSCRVLGMDVESGVLRHVLRHNFRSPDMIKARFKKTELNLACRDLFQKNGFKATNTHGDISELLLQWHELGDVPKHLTIS